MSDDARADRRPPGGRAAGRGLVDHAAVARRLRRWLVLLVVAVPTVWLVAGAASGGPEPARLAELAGVALLLGVVVEAVVVGGAAVRGALRAGARGERLASGDVALLPPQLRRRGGR